MIEAVTFDLGDTISDLGEGRGDYESRAVVRAGRCYDVLAGGGLSLGDRATFAAELADAIETRYQVALGERRGVLIFDILRAYFAEKGLHPDEDLLHSVGAAYSSLTSTHPPLTRIGAVATLAALRDQGLRLGVVSNTVQPGAYMDTALARNGLIDFFPVRVYSSEVGVSKPHPDIFRVALDALAVSPERAVHVGDRLAADVLGAQLAGMHTVLIEVAHRVESDPHIIPDARIRELPELIELVNSQF